MSNPRGRPRDPSIRRAISYCETHGLTEHAEYHYAPSGARGDEVNWRCMRCMVESHRKNPPNPKMRGTRPHTPERPPAPVCPTCFMELPATGICDDCEGR